MNVAVALPEPLQKFAGRIPDIDSHEMIPAQEWVSVFGPEVRPMAELWLAKAETDQSDKNSPNIPGYPGDIQPIGADISAKKGARAPGAYDMSRRIGVMDAMGVSKQLMFSSYVGIFSLIMMMKGADSDFMAELQQDRKPLARRLLNIYSDWAIEVGKASDRVRPVMPVYAESVDELMATTRSLLAKGVRAIQLPVGNLPGGVSPAHPALDPFWAMLSEANCAFMMHIGCESKFFETREWGKAPVFEGFRNLGEFSVDPWTTSVLHIPFQNFIATMVVGGVFERHPNLYVGVIEVGTHWVGAMMRCLDIWHDNSGAFKNKGVFHLAERPSHYVRKNVRVAPFIFEPFDEFIEQYGLEDVICFSTDYPHIEGGMTMFQTYYDKVKRLGPDIVEKFFVKNGSCLLQD
jgi:predicted TIM-barrel fold metal-dependent hydrolase